MEGLPIQTATLSGERKLPKKGSTFEINKNKLKNITKSAKNVKFQSIESLPWENEKGLFFDNDFDKKKFLDQLYVDLILKKQEISDYFPLLNASNKDTLEAIRKLYVKNRVDLIILEEEKRFQEGLRRFVIGTDKAENYKKSFKY